MVVFKVYKVWVYYEFGFVKDVFKFEEVVVFEVKLNQVFIKVKVVVINFVDNKC